ncbi:MAG: 3'(2'),5'-bisphosphate nucleotidase CysQ [Candidatus Berkiellales bacterium]
MQLAEWADYAYLLAQQAGEAILSLYDADPVWSVQYKEDKSPVTVADQVSHDILYHGLANFILDDHKPAPVLSEEGKLFPFSDRQSWTKYWCVDPLDGTKDFIARNNEFTVNIALINDHEPIIGIVYVPTQKCGYLAWRGGGAYRCDEFGNKKRINTQVPSARPLRVLASRHHGLDALEPRLAALGEITLMRQGSALKFCTLAQGDADVFLRLSPSSEWDNAAGQCLLEEAGGGVFSWDGEMLTYNRSGTLEQQRFIALGDVSYPWQKHIVR